MPNKREIKQELTFKEEGTFRSFSASGRWLHLNGYEYGSMDSSNPIAIQLGHYSLPEKWHNFKPEHKAQVDGIMTSNDWREGEVKVTLYK